LSAHAVLCKMTVEGHISTIPVNYIQGKPYYVYLSNVASGLDARSSSYIVGDISPTILIW